MKTSIKNLVYFLVIFLLSLVLFSCYNSAYPPLGKKISKELTESYNKIADELGIPYTPKGLMWTRDASAIPFDKAPWDIEVGFEYYKYNIVCSLRVKKEGN